MGINPDKTIFLIVTGQYLTAQNAQHHFIKNRA